MRKNLAALALLTSGALALAGCGEDDPAATAHNEADVTFAREMVPHHRQAVEMAALADERAGDRDVRRLAEDIESAQAPEIATMTGWLEAWDEEVPPEAMDHADMGHGSSDAMAGMMSEEDMAALEQAQGAAFDELFLELMVEHHEGALEMARTEQAAGENPDALALAELIEADQEAEISEMQRLLGS